MITALGIGTKQAPDNVNLDPQRQFWSWLYSFKAPRSEQTTTPWRNGYFTGFSITQTDPVGMSVQIGGTDPVDSALLEYGSGKMTLLSTDGTPQVVTIPTAPTSGSRIDTIVSYIDTTSADPESETPGTPEYVKTVVVSGTASSSPTAPNKQQIQAALPPTVENWYQWADVRVAQGTTVITNSNITDKKPASPNVYSTSILDLIYPIGAIAIGAKPSIGTWERIQGRFLWASNTAHPAGSTGGSETVALGDANLPFSAIVDKQSNTGGWGAQFVTVPSGNYVMGAKGSDATPHENMPPYLSVDMWRRTA